MRAFDGVSFGARSDWEGTLIPDDTKAGFRISLEDRKAKDVLTVHLTGALR